VQFWDARPLLTASVELQRRYFCAIHRQLKDIEPIVVTDDVVHLLRRNTPRKVDLRVDNSLIVDQRITHDPSIGSDDA
jgi:hypothetical protein